MNDTLKNILRKDETVLWAGAPEPVDNRRSRRCQRQRRRNDDRGHRQPR